MIDPDRFPPTVNEAINAGLARTMSTASGLVSAGLASLIGLLAHLPWLVLIPILAFFLLKDADRFRRSALLMLPHGRLRGQGAGLVQDVNDALAAYIRAQLIACMLIGSICTLGFGVIGVPYALLLGLIAALLEFIPLVGPLVVAVFAAVVSSFHSVGRALVVLLFLGVLRIVHDYVIYPRLMGHGIHLHPLAVILAILSGAEVAGVAGIFLAIPVTALLSVGYRHWVVHRGGPGLVADLLGPLEQSLIAGGVLRERQPVIGRGALPSLCDVAAPHAFSIRVLPP